MEIYIYNRLAFCSRAVFSINVFRDQLPTVYLPPPFPLRLQFIPDNVDEERPHQLLKLEAVLIGPMLY